MTNSRSKHIEIKHHYIRELVKAEYITITYCPTNLMLGDMFTKPLPAPRFAELAGMVMGHAFPHAVETALTACAVMPKLSYLHQVVARALVVGRPIHLVELCGGGMVAILEGCLAAGVSISLYTYSDMDLDVRRVAAARIANLRKKYPCLLPETAVKGWSSRLPQDVCNIKPMDWSALSQPVDLLAAGPPCQPFSRAGQKLGWKDPRAQPFVHITNIISHLQRMQGSISYIIENVPAALHYPEIIEALGYPVLLKAHMLGSVAKRDTLVWTNATCLHTSWQKVELNYDETKAPTVQEVLAKHHLTDWDVRGEWQRILPKFVARANSWAFINGGPGMLLHNGVLEEPSPEVREVAMGYDIGSTVGDDISHALRHSVLGACID